MTLAIGGNIFSLDYYRSILTSSLDAGYKICTIEDYWELGCPAEKHFVLRHDLDLKPHLLDRMLDVERSVGCRSTVYVRVAGSPYNFLEYSTFRVLQQAQADKFRIGLHSNYCEFAHINGIKDPLDVLEQETRCLKTYFDVQSVAPHRDINYAINSLPHLEENWSAVAKMGYRFQAYDNRIIGPTTYINKTLNPHLTWRGKTPFDIIPSGKSMYLLTHPHWWYLKHPFEEWNDR